MKRRITFLHLFLMNQLILTLVVLGLIGAYGVYLVSQEQFVLKDKTEALLAREADRIGNDLAVQESTVLRLKGYVENFDFIDRDIILNRFHLFAADILKASDTVYNAWFALGAKWSKKYFGKEGFVLTVHKDFKDTDKIVVQQFMNPGYEEDPNIEWWMMNKGNRNVNSSNFYFDVGFMDKVMYSTGTGIYQHDKLEAVVGVDTLVSEIAKRLSDFKLGSTGGLLIVDEHGRPILSLLPRSLPLIGYTYRNAKSVEEFNKMPKFAEKAFDVAGNKLHDFKGADGEVYITLAKSIKGRPWHLVVYQTKDEAYAGLYRRLFVLILVVMVAFLIVSVALYFTGQLVMRRQKSDYEILRISRDQARAATEAKSTFLSTMSHEIRTPLNSMLGSAELLLETSLNQEQLEYIQSLRGAGDSLLGVLNNVLDFSKIEAGKMNLEINEFKLSDLIGEVTVVMSAPMNRKHLQLNVVTPEIDRYVMGDYMRIKQVLLNLLGNAVKFTDKGKIDLRLTARSLPESEIIRYHFEVCDTGVGIAKENLNKIFDEFSQEDSSVTRRFGGTGLGLSISRKLVKLMGGEIGCQSQQQVGSVFYFYLDLPSRSAGSWHPRLESLMVAPAIVTLEEQLQSFDQQKRVLLVDDMEDNHHLMRAYLKKLSHIILESAFSGSECMEKLEATQYDLIFMDVQMPRISGLETIYRIREFEQRRGLRRTPIVVVSANNFTEDREKSLAAGADDHCGKPVRKQAIVDLVCRYCLEESAPPVIN